MSDEEYLINEIMRRFGLLKKHPALCFYFERLPESGIRGKAHHLSRQYVKEIGKGKPLSDEDKEAAVLKICQLILNEIIQKIRMPVTGSNYMERDGAELFYRRALNQISRECYSDAERLLRRAVDIFPEFIDAWEVLVEVYTQNGNENLAAQANLRLQELKEAH